MASSRSARPEMLQVADTVAREKGIERDEVLEAMEQAIQKAGARQIRPRERHPRRASTARPARSACPADAGGRPVENETTADRRCRRAELNPGSPAGDFIVDPLPPIDFGRIAAQTAKQVIVQRVREAERKRQYDEFKDRVGEIVNGVVKRVEYGNVHGRSRPGRGDAAPRRDDPARELFSTSDRVRAYHLRRARGAARPADLPVAHPSRFMAKLFAQEVPEIYDGIIEIKAVARDPGSRAKIAVIAAKLSIDPVGACVGMRGSRVQAVVQELQGEKIDIIPWSPDPATFVVNAWPRPR